MQPFFHGALWFYGLRYNIEIHLQSTVLHKAQHDIILNLFYIKGRTTTKLVKFLFHPQATVSSANEGTKISFCRCVINSEGAHAVTRTLIWRDRSFISYGICCKQSGVGHVFLTARGDRDRWVLRAGGESVQLEGHVLGAVRDPLPNSSCREELRSVF